MIYELLKPEDYACVIPTLRQFFNDNIPTVGIAAVAHDNDKIAGILCLQPVLHAEPLVVLPEYRGKVDVVKLYRNLMTAVPKGTPHYAFVPDNDRRVAQITGACGLKPMNWSVWQGIS